MSTIDRIARDIARPTRGLALASSLVAAGIARSTVTTRVRRGVWQRPAPNVIDVTDAIWDWPRQVTLAVLTCGADAAASHSTAAAVLDLPGFRRGGTIHVTAVRSRRSLQRRFTVHSTRVPDTDRRLVDGIVVASPARTLLGLAGADTDDRALHRAVRAVLQRGLARPDQLCHDSLTNIPGAGRLREVTQRETVHASKRVESGLEEVAVDALIRLRDLPPFCTQHETVVDGRLARLDIAWPEREVTVEVDGSAWHDDELSTLSDHERQAVLEAAGWRVVRVRAADLAPGNLARLHARIATALGTAVT